MEQITSAQNSKIKNANKLKKKRDRDKTGQALIEGIHLIEEAYQSDIVIKQLFVIEPNRTDEALKDYAEETFEINMKVAESLSGTITPQGFFAVIEKPKYDVTQAKQVLLIDRIQDPGNLGTLIRTSDAAGIDLIVMEKGTADPYQDKVLRASQGSVFHIPVITADLKTFIADFNGPVYGTALENAQPYKEVASQDIFALLLGNEGEGVNKALLNETSQNLTIPIYGKAESLNVAIAGSILLYHLKG
ncbi:MULTISPECIES: TrmH family RNA methyltransferase [Staphylococcus]|jgi:TrmH family RNA methyltransferase|uniref:RNA methyltransferase n=2 Tax=Staphylococcus haemolyticus TaxID=1283 RepID=A0A2K0A8S4_STAHA|nr:MULTISPECIES: RNA methyltransferase [Staphylococcus]MBY6179237.1 RNA methyltransferase [Staphylococcaceae bacterium DP2N0-1]KGF28393.1 RNA methyltransferase [Staphylococcus haemolyticus DNF00585]MCH4389727.1 RNA methyltransferase [Staphylococcus haemolyticus]MCH4402580.1 RNA methyltransferase [Staphylococcus haemolyticus]MCH4442808.1 RNA methyltransferase [Staphylococcus haemolyticus]